MIGRVRHWTIVGASTLAVAVLAASGVTPAAGQRESRGYLTVLGPVPLRFRPTEMPATNLVRLTLPPPDPEPAIMAPPSDTSVTNKTAPPLPTPPVAPAQIAAPVVLTNQPEPAVAPPSADPMISPQMLLKYFNRSTNGPSSGIIAPMDFAPPSAVRPASGSATYSTDPK